ncbi:hypothetical protein [Marinobacterium weihaiense]|uniref:Uncharacterized protein n=1 Tax=Marinobacterium weihaiense TaxID=2851016 RepID=A0ABS6MEI6_9GAMM|nr:hypothetical protein [Marinobacterium weihaiense]MBV0934738.1 hypothetical protein [Marinobacterium weihaiense]
MKTPKEKLADDLGANGWYLEVEIVEDLDWWADEIWEMRSTWSPEGVPAYITFLVDPQHQGARKKGQAVWGVGNSPKLPATLEEAQCNGVVSLNDIFKNKAEEFMHSFETLRSGAINDIGL